MFRFFVEFDSINNNKSVLIMSNNMGPLEAGLYADLKYADYISVFNSKRKDLIELQKNKINIFKNNMIQTYGEVFKYIITDDFFPNYLDYPDKLIDNKYDQLYYCQFNYGDMQYENSNMITIIYLLMNVINVKGNVFFSFEINSYKIMRLILILLTTLFENVIFKQNLLSFGFTICECINFSNNFTQKEELYGIAKEIIKHNDNNIIVDDYIDDYIKRLKLNNKSITKGDILYDKYISIYKEIEVKYNNIKDSLKNNNFDILHESEENIMNYLKESEEEKLYTSIQLCKKYNIPLKPEYDKSFDIYKQKLVYNTIGIPQSYVIQLVDYDILCKKDAKTLKNNYHKNNNFTLNFKRLYPDAKTNTEPIKCSKFTFEPQKYKYSENTFQNKKLADNKSILNFYKVGIDSRDINHWRKTTSVINIPHEIMKYIKTDYDTTVTRAFIKMFEILNEFNLVDDSIKSFHTCEAPGHFINATNYYMKLQNKDAKLDWHANSLNPYNETNRKKYKHIFADQYGFIKKYRNKWLWGKDDTGDITNIENVKYYEKYFEYSVDLFTSDCGLEAETKEHFKEQEARLSILNYSQVLISLVTLKKGGNAVYKLFAPLSEGTTISIVFLVMKFFEQVYFVKQLSGSPGSSEVYLVAKNKLDHLDDELKKYLFDCLINYNYEYSLFPSDIYNKYFILQMEKISTMFVKKQLDTLKRSFFYNDNPEVLKEHEELIDDAKYLYYKHWIKANNFVVLDDKYMI
jgi:23S rRNA U2552 (ribose-2'-O)-methylase RlmE/FtsJ